MIELKYLLPIGSIVKLKTEDKRLMVIGVYQEDTQTHQQYDYSGLVYPEGLIGDAQFMFNHQDIDSVVFRGYEDSERVKMLAELEQSLTNADVEAAEKVMDMFVDMFLQKDRHNIVKVDIDGFAVKYNVELQAVKEVLNLLVEENFLTIENIKRNKYKITDYGEQEANAYLVQNQ